MTRPSEKNVFPICYTLSCAGISYTSPPLSAFQMRVGGGRLRPLLLRDFATVQNPLTRIFCLDPYTSSLLELGPMVKYIREKGSRAEAVPIPAVWAFLHGMVNNI